MVVGLVVMPLVLLVLVVAKKASIRAKLRTALQLALAVLSTGAVCPCQQQQQQQQQECRRRPPTFRATAATVAYRHRFQVRAGCRRGWRCPSPDTQWAAALA